MRKVLAAFIAVLLVASCATVYGVTKLAETSDNVHYTEEVMYGDRSLLDGLTVCQVINHTDYLQWNSEVRFTKDGYTETTNSEYSSVPFSMRNVTPSHGGMMVWSDYLGDDVTYSRYIGQVVGLETTSQQKLCEHMRSVAQEGNEVTVKVDMSDYFTYLPLVFQIDLPGITYSSYDVAAEDSPEGVAMRDLYSFFKIPVPKGTCVNYAVLLDGDNVRYTSIDYEGVDFYLQNLMGSDTLYLYFNNQYDGGSAYDCSEIPGGYGIYSLPYDGDGHKEGNLHTEKLKLLYAMEESSDIQALELSEDEKTLLLVTSEEDEIYATKIDAKTGEQLQKIRVCSESDDGLSIIPADDGSRVFFQDKQAYVLYERNGELHVMKMGEPKDIDFSEGLVLGQSGNRAAFFDGRHLTVIGQLAREEGNGDFCVLNGFYVTVYDESGLCYYGNYESSLKRLGDPYAGGWYASYGSGWYITTNWNSQIASVSVEA